MTVQELITKLQVFEANTEVLHFNQNCDSYDPNIGLMLSEYQGNVVVLIYGS